MNFRRTAFFKALVASLFTVLAFSSFITALARSGSRSVRVQFIDNSYTYLNDLPEISTKLSEAGHQGKVETMMVAPGQTKEFAFRRRWPSEQHCPDFPIQPS